MDEMDEAWESFLTHRCREEPLLRGARLLNRLTRRRAFKDLATARSYRDKERRILTTIALGTPDRVPVISNGMSFYPAHYSGVSFAEYVMDGRNCTDAYLKFTRENTRFDGLFPPHAITLGRLISISRIDYVKLPGVDLPEGVPYQFVEKERMSADEYPRLLEDAMEFFEHVVLPRVSPLCDPVKGWPRPVLARLAWEMLARTVRHNRLIDTVEKEYGVPVLTPVLFFEPYDLLGIFLRGMTGVSRDIKTQPEMVERAADVMVPIAVRMYESMVAMSGVRVAVVLCERAFSLSPKQFTRFSLPTLKRVVDALHDRGILPIVTLEGDCTHLFEIMTELPVGKCVCNVDTGDIFRAKKVLAGHMCVVGNVPMMTMVKGTPADVREYCARLIEEVAPGGGYIMSGALGIPDNARPENVRAMVEYVLEHGEY
jgi:hypothetical protein